MKQRVVRMVGPLFFLFSISVNAEDRVLYCVEDRAIGHIFSDDEWRTGSFTTKRFTVKVLETQTFADREYLYNILVDKRNYSCRQPWRDSVVCIDNSFGHANAFIFNRVSNRFTSVNASVFGYTFGDEGDSEELSAGKCEDF